MSRTVREIIDEVDNIKPNAFDEAQKVRWLNSLEGRIQLSVMLMAHTEVISYELPADRDSEVLLEAPHDDIYGAWLAAQIDYANGEYDRYQNTMQLFNAMWGDFVRWFAGTYAPAQGYTAEGAS